MVTITINNTKATQTQIREQAMECLETYEANHGRRTIRKYTPDAWENIPHEMLKPKHYDPIDVEAFIGAFEEEFGLPVIDWIDELESKIHELPANGNYIPIIPAFKLCLKYWLDENLWE